MSSLSLFEGNCNGCPLQGKDSFIGKDGLYNLFQAAYKQYVAEVISSGKLYQRYAEDFLNGHTHSVCQCFHGKNEYGKNLGVIRGILLNYKETVEKQWNKGLFDKEHFMAVKHLYDTDVFLPLDISRPAVRGNYGIQTTFECYLTMEQMDLIAECANEAHLFYGRVTKEDMYALLHCKAGFHLYASRINRIAKLFDCLNYHKLVCRKWQAVLSSNKLILSAKTGKPVSSSSFSSALTKLNKREEPVIEYIGVMVKRVKEMSATDERENK